MAAPDDGKAFYNRCALARQAWRNFRIVSVEGLTGFKLQRNAPDATRTWDLEDIRALLKIHRASINLDELRDYFALFKKPELLNGLLDELPG